MPTTQINQQNQILDPNYIATVAIPAANGADVQTTPFDLAQAGDMVLDHILAQVLVPALPNNVTSSISLAVTIYQGSTSGSLSAIPELEPFLVPGVASTGSLATAFAVRLPPDTLEFVAANVHAPTGVGNNTASSVTFQFAF